jgi:hypothetical protein
MGEYEDRYPESYGRGETEGQSTAERDIVLPPRQTRDVPLPRRPIDIPSDTGAARQPVDQPLPIVEPVAQPRRRYDDTHRGMGPRGYVRSDRRIYEDICDRLTENPFIDASEMEVAVTGSEVRLSGRVGDMIALRQAEAIAQEVAGVSRVRNELVLRSADERRDATAGDEVNRAMGPAAR